MKKKDLKDGMVVELDDKCTDNANERLYLLQNGKLYGIYTSGYELLSNYNDDLTFYDEGWFIAELGTWNILKVYRVINNQMAIVSRFEKDNLELIWERETRKLNWNKVPKGTKAITYNFLGDEVNVYLMDYVEGAERPFKLSKSLYDDFTGYKPTVGSFEECKLHPSVKPKDEWFD